MNGNGASQPEPPEGLEARLGQRQHAQAALERNRVSRAFQQHGLIPNSLFSISIVSFLLGGLFVVSFAACCVASSVGVWWATYQFFFLTAAWALFHWLEFAVTAGWNPSKASVDSFLLDNGMLYHATTLAALTEYLITLYFKPSWKQIPYVSIVGISVVVIGQVLRTTAMIHASTNFNHTVQFYKADTHKLVTDGIYAWCRHPSYAGFFYWGIGTQLVLQNPLSVVVYAALMWKFFHDRIRVEERALVKFFGQDYVDYRARVGTKIPFIR